MWAGYCIIQTMLMRYQSAFSLLEALFAWGVFLLFILSLVFAQARALRKLRVSYLDELAVIQILNIKDMLLSTAAVHNHQQILSVWHKYNQIILPNTKDSYSCDKKICCAYLSKRRYILSSCFR
jgi:Tfp pilus assembly protein PilV